MNTTLGSDSNMQYVCDWARKSGRLAQFSTADLLHVPSRLIDVSAEKLRIIDTSSLQSTEEKQPHGFAALSYVWGTNQTFVLLRRTKDSLMLSFDIQQLPQTIQDAVIVTRKIGLRYLWVDAL